MKTHTIVATLIVLTGLSLAGPALAQANPPGINLTIDLVISRLQFLACWAFRMAATLTFIMIVVYGLMFLISGGDSSKFQEARKALTSGIIGAFIILGVYVIIVTVAAAVGSTSFSLGFSC